jgi:hypothetical protein
MLARLLLLAVTLLGANALACSCRGTTRVFPPAGSEVPTNVVFQVTQNAGELAPLKLFEGSQTPVEVDSVVHHPRWVTVRPRAPLLPGATYRLTDGMEFTATFTAEAGADETAPAPRALLSTRRTFVPGNSTCGNAESVQLTLEAAATGEPTALLVFSGVTTSSLGAEASGFTEGTLLSDSLCAQNFSLLTTPDLALAVRVIDAAGNLSEASSAKQVKTAGCSSAPALLGVFGVLLLLPRRLA